MCKCRQSEFPPTKCRQSECVSVGNRSSLLPSVVNRSSLLPRAFRVVNRSSLLPRAFRVGNWNSLLPRGVGNWNSLLPRGVGNWNSLLPRVSGIGVASYKDKKDLTKKGCYAIIITFQPPKTPIYAFFVGSEKILDKNTQIQVEFGYTKKDIDFFRNHFTITGVKVRYGKPNPQEDSIFFKKNLTKNAILGIIKCQIEVSTKESGCFPRKPLHSKTSEDSIFFEEKFDITRQM